MNSPTLPTVPASRLGRPVLHTDVQHYASRKCRVCRGTGVLTIHPPGKSKRVKACGCAVKRFVAAKQDLLGLGAAPEGEAPPLHWLTQEVTAEPAQAPEKAA